MARISAEKQLLALGDEVLTMKFGLRNMRTLLQALGAPHHAYPSIHVAGTNGKGSVCAMLDSILRASGRRVGLFTSPHLTSIRERMKINGRDISPAEFTKSYKRVARVIRRLRATRHLASHPTYFETITAMAFEYFARAKVEVAVVEVGMGGRLDSTNLITPVVSLITSIDFDHERFLGNTVRAIAREKAGIIKTGVPVVTAARRADALGVIRKVARYRKSPFHHAGSRARISNVKLELDGSRFSLTTPGGRYEEVELHLAGRHQIDNAVLAIRGLEECCRRGLSVSRQDIVTGLRTVRWPGRFERVSARPEIFIDGAHNPAGAIALRRAVESLLGGRKIILIYGAMRDKAIRKVFHELEPIASQVIFTRPAIHRAATPEEIFCQVGETGGPSFLARNLPLALKLAQHLAKPTSTILVTGSLYLVGEARRMLIELSTEFVPTRSKEIRH
ncbi:MAG: bifunctional folylpolyglutamate synthase/dihydrofolate synthase [Acidobacteriia bacterium]|nr:bifunctional folylpolyglutamate synthase/dihydrofolate synthase [Terriglobia bacterium]